MKKIFPILAIATSFAIQASAQAPSGKFKFDGGDVFSFGTIKRGADASHTFEFVNTGNKPINIMAVKPSCGCTKVEWTKHPVAPGEKGFITLSLITMELNGIFDKTVSIQSDVVLPPGERYYTLRIKGDAQGDAQ